jgi:C1A family cysteine protease
MPEKKRPVTAASLQSAILAKGFNWTAGKTSVSDLSDRERKARLGLRVDPKEIQATAKAIAAAEQMRALAAIAAPPSVDWRNHGGDWITSVKDQSSCGACVSFAVIGTIEARVNIACNDVNVDKDFSEAHLFFCGCGSCCDTGWDFQLALDFCKNTGMCDDSVFPYTPHNQPCPALTPTFKITSWSSILPVADRKNALATKGPLVAGMAVYDDFFSYKSGVYKHVSGSLAGYHAVCCAGYDDAQGCWICKNSWGPGWGDAGFFRIGYGEADMDTSFAMYDVDVKCPAPVPPPDRCQEYIPLLRRVLMAAQANRALRLCLRYYVCGRGTRPYCNPSRIQVVKAVLQILRQCPKYRGPFCQALG